MPLAEFERCAASVGQVHDAPDENGDSGQDEVGLCLGDEDRLLHGPFPHHRDRVEETGEQQQADENRDREAQDASKACRG